MTERASRFKAKAALGPKAIGGNPDDVHIVAADTPAITVVESGGGKGVGRSDEMQRRDLIESEKADALWSHGNDHDLASLGRFGLGHGTDRIGHVEMTA